MRIWARRRGYVDVSDNVRRIHTEPTPSVGGVAVALVTTITFVAWSTVLVDGQVYRPEIVAMLLGGLAMLVVGFWDDTRHLGAGAKFFLQVVIAVTVYFGGVRIAGAGFDGVWLAGAVSLVVTTVWIVGTTNAFNLIDGSDGVAAGAALFASISIGVVLALNGDPFGALMATILVGVALGFLCFNFPPASIFLGDSGSLFIGYTLATLGVITTLESTTVLAIAIPAVAFGVPLLDTSLTIVRRFLRREPIFQPDRGHIHHRLRDLGHAPRSVAMLLYLACAAFASLSLLLAAPGRPTVLPVFVVAAAVLVVGVQRLGVPEFVELSRVMGQSFRQRGAIAQNLRLREAAGALERAWTGEEVGVSLQLAFVDSGFDRVEIALTRDLASVLGRAGLAEIDPVAVGRRFTVTLEQRVGSAVEVEYRVPVLEGEDRVGWISMYRDCESQRPATDLHLISRSLLPALVGALGRVAAQHPGGDPLAQRTPAVVSSRS